MNLGKARQETVITAAKDTLGQILNPFTLPEWLPELKDKAVLRADFMAGLTVALILPGDNIRQSVFNLTEAKILSRQDVLQKIELDPNLIRDFRLEIKTGLTPRPIVVF